MKTKFGLNSLLLLVLMPAASMAADLDRINPANPDCELIRKKVDGVISLKKADAALAVLAEFRSPTKADLEAVMPALKNNVEENFNRYLILAKSDCFAEKLRLTRFLMSAHGASSTPPDEKTKIASKIQASLRGPTYPTYLAAAIKIVILNEGHEKRVWQLRSEDVGKVKQMRDEIKAGSRAMTAKFEQVAKMLGKQTPSVESLKTNKLFQEIKQIFFEEAQDARSYLDRLDQITDRLNTR